MTTHTEVISAFLDNEPFDPQALADALADPAGRELLLDLVALRQLVHSEDAPVPVASPGIGRRVVRGSLAAAAVLAAVWGAYAAGARTAATASVRPPEPTRVVDLDDVQWVHVSPEGRQ